MRHTSSHVFSLALTGLNRATPALPDGESAAQMEKKKQARVFTTDINNPCRKSIDWLCGDLCASQATSDQILPDIAASHSGEVSACEMMSGLLVVGEVGGFWFLTCPRQFRLSCHHSCSSSPQGCSLLHRHSEQRNVIHQCSCCSQLIAVCTQQY